MAEPIMLQGTMSNVGKSFLAAALCRILRREGYSVAPFKSQNMALNSFITADGFEIGRAQALQAQAAGLEPSVLMNPILLKPTTDVGSQVIVNGKPRGNMRAAEYFRHKRELIPEIMRAYNELSARHDVIVIEGAGSPAELNLKADDIVNMGLAELVNAPVLLIGDIDRGGVFAQLIGTVGLLEPRERERIKGLIVNRFRGDISLFRDGISILEEKSRKPVVGVVPYIKCDLEDEDSLSDKLTDTAPDGFIDIAVIRLPRISNFTDLDVFGQFEGVSVRFVSSAARLGTPDLIIIPGTKSTLSDMRHLRESGMESAIKNAAEKGVPIFGICGGYQMMGRRISDPCGSEGGGSIKGMGLLDCETVFGSAKQQRQVSGRFLEADGFFGCLSGAEFYGYEVHMGSTVGPERQLTDVGGSVRGNIAGCYVHGIFDSGEVCSRLVKRLYAERNAEFTGAVTDRREYRERQLDMLADKVSESLDMELVHRIIGEGM